MAIVTRYFSTTSAGAADGTTWADRAALFATGNWSTVITGFNFSGSDSLVCRIGPGSYTCSQSLASGLFSNAPSVANLLFLHGCDSSGNLLTPPDPDWQSCMVAWDDSSLPVIASSTNIATVDLSNCAMRLLKFTASGRNGAMLNNARTDWVVGSNSTNNSSANAASGTRFYNSVFSCSGAAYASVLSVSTDFAPIFNCRVSGVAGSSGNRYGINPTGNGAVVCCCTVYGVGGAGVIVSSGSTGAQLTMIHTTIANVGGNGLTLPSTASQTTPSTLIRNLITGCGGYGMDAQSAARAVLSQNRLRDNASGNLNGFGNYPTDFGNYTTDSDDATEYVDASSTFDFRVKNSAGIWGGGYGAGDQPASASGGAAGRRNMRGGFIN